MCDRLDACNRSSGSVRHCSLDRAGGDRYIPDSSMSTQAQTETSLANMLSGRFVRLPRTVRFYVWLSAVVLTLVIASGLAVSHVRVASNVELNARTPVFTQLSPWGRVLGEPNNDYLKSSFDIIGVVTPVPEGTASYDYIADPGRDLESIAMEYGIDMDLLASANRRQLRACPEAKVRGPAAAALLARAQLGSLARVPLPDIEERSDRRERQGEAGRADHHASRRRLRRVPLEHRQEVRRPHGNDRRDERPAQRAVPSPRADSRGTRHRRDLRQAEQGRHDNRDLQEVRGRTDGPRQRQPGRRREDRADRREALHPRLGRHHAALPIRVAGLTAGSPDATE